MIIASISYKGGVGKSTVARNMAVFIAEQGQKVCIVDADETAATTEWFADRQDNSDTNKSFIQVIQMIDPKAIIPSVKGLYKDYDVIIIDAPPSINPIASKIMLLAHLIIVPVAPKGKQDYTVTAKFIDRYQEIMQQKEGVTPAYFLLNMYRNTNFNKAFEEVLKDYGTDTGIGVLKSKLSELTDHAEATQEGITAYEYSKGKAKREVKAMCEEIIGIAVNT